MKEFLDGVDRGNKEWRLILGLQFQQGRQVAAVEAGGVAFLEAMHYLGRALGFKRLESFPMGWDPGLIKKGETSCMPAHSSLFLPWLQCDQLPLHMSSSALARMDPWNYKPQQNLPPLSF